MATNDQELEAAAFRMRERDKFKAAMKAYYDNLESELDEPTFAERLDEIMHEVVQEAWE